MKSAAITLRNWFSNFRRSSATELSLAFFVTGLVLFGLLMVYSASYILAQERTGNGMALIQKQIAFAILGLGALMGTSKLDYRFWDKWAYAFLGLAFVLVVMTFVPGLGARVGGARRWVRIGVAQFQPGELAKFAVLFFAVRQLVRKRDRLHTWTAGVLAPFLVPIPLMILLLRQPDFGTVVMLGVVLFILLYLAGTPIRILGATFAGAVTIAAYLALGSEYRRQRLMTYLDPWKDQAGKGFQILQSFVGLHHGGLTGVGLGNGKEKLFYLPEAHNDFIFSVIGEEMGFLGVALLIITFFMFIYLGLQIAWRAEKIHRDPFGYLLASAITLSLGLQAFVNMAVVLGLLPTKGLNLPFVSYGGSSLLVDLAAVGILLSVARGPARE